MSKSIVQRWFELFGVQPDRQCSFRLSAARFRREGVRRRRVVEIIAWRAIRRGTFSSIGQLRKRIEAFVEHYKTNCRAFVWTAIAESIRDEVKRTGLLVSGTAH